MNYMKRFVILGVLVAVSACGKQEGTQPQVADAPVPAAQPMPAPAPIVNPVDTLERTMATDVVNTKIGSLVDGKLTNGGKGGYLLFGPYVSFLAGTYTVTVTGHVDKIPSGQKVRVDVSSNKGTVGHGQVEISEAGDLPGFEFTLPEAVGDLEVRVFVPAGSEVAIESYRVAKKT